MRFLYIFSVTLALLATVCLRASATPLPAIDPKLRAWQWDRRFCRIACRFVSYGIPTESASAAASATLSSEAVPTSSPSVTFDPLLSESTSVVSSSGQASPTDGLPSNSTVTDRTAQSSGASQMYRICFPYVTALGAVVTVVLLL